AHAPEYLARAAGADDGDVAVVDEAPRQTLLHADGLDLGEQELGGVPGHEPDLEDDAARGHRELARHQLHPVDEPESDADERDGGPGPPEPRRPPPPTGECGPPRRPPEKPRR